MAFFPPSEKNKVFIQYPGSSGPFSRETWDKIYRLHGFMVSSNPETDQNVIVF